MFHPILAVMVLASGAKAGPVCPTEAATRQALGVDGAWQVACHVTKDEPKEVLVAALRTPETPGAPPRLVISAQRGDWYHPRVELAIGDLTRDLLEPFAGDEWRLSIRPAAIKAANWLRVDVTAQSGTDLRVAQTVTVFIREGFQLTPLWTGTSDRHEVRAGACRVDTTAHFTLSRKGELIRTTRAKRAFRDPGGVDAATLASVKEACTAPRSTPDAFPVADDGLDTNVSVDESLRARARANRLLYLRASGSDQAFARFVADSVALRELLLDAVGSGQPIDPEQEISIAVSGVFVYTLEGGLRSGLDWKNLAAVAKPASAPLLAALRDFDTDEWGVWIEPETDLGGCHSPAKAAVPLAALVAAWQAAPEAVRGAFRAPLLEALTAMTTNGCFCAPKADLGKLKEELERNAVLLDGLSEVAPTAAAQLRALPTAPNTAFGCIGPH